MRLTSALCEFQVSWWAKNTAILTGNPLLCLNATNLFPLKGDEGAGFKTIHMKGCLRLWRDDVCTRRTGLVQFRFKLVLGDEPWKNTFRLREALSIPCFCPFADGRWAHSESRILLVRSGRLSLCLWCIRWSIVNTTPMSWGRHDTHAAVGCAQEVVLVGRTQAALCQSCWFCNAAVAPSKRGQQLFSFTPKWLLSHCYETLMTSGHANQEKHPQFIVLCGWVVFDNCSNSLRRTKAEFPGSRSPKFFDCNAQ